MARFQNHTSSYCFHAACSTRRYEGPGCDIDINECVRGTAGCAANAGCRNTNGSFACTCRYGYSGARPRSEMK